MASISPEAVSERREADDVLLLDVRPPDAFADWHVPGSRNVDVYKALKNDPDDARDALGDLPADREIVTICGAGVLSATATELLTDMGYDAKTMTDGLEGWSRVHRTAPLGTAGPGTLVQVARPATGCLSYVVIADGAAAVVDPSRHLGEYEAVVAAHDATLAAVLETHAHADHVSGAEALAAAHDVPHYLHPADAGELTETAPLRDGDELRIGDLTLRVVHTPGHTPGSVTLAVEERALLTGDTLFLDGVGRPDLEGGTAAAVRRRAETLYESLQRLLAAPADALVAPAHDAGTPRPPVSATLSAVRDRNDRLAADREAFVETTTANVPETPPNHERIKRANTGRERLDDGEAAELELGPNRCAVE